MVNLKQKLNLHYAEVSNRAPVSRILEISCIPCNSEIFPDYLALYHHKEEYHKTTLTGVCFFTYDNKFDNQKGLYNAIYFDSSTRLKPVDS